MTVESGACPITKEPCRTSQVELDQIKLDEARNFGNRILPHYFVVTMILVLQANSNVVINKFIFFCFSSVFFTEKTLIKVMKI